MTKSDASMRSSTTTAGTTANASPLAWSGITPNAGISGSTLTPMGQGELYQWHLRNGTVELFFAMLPT
jgi:hypothetical protein